MKIVLRDGARMVLQGVPQGRGMWFGAAVCAALVIASGLFAYGAWVKTRSLWSVAAPGGACAFSVMLSGILASLALKRERLELDKVTRTAVHRTWNVLLGRVKEKSIPRERIHAVAVQRTMQAPGGGRGFPTKVTTARLLLIKPKRAIDLDEVQGGDPEPVIALASEVAEFLGVEVLQLGRHDD